MFPPELADFSFHPDSGRGDDVLAARVAELAGTDPVLVFGVCRPGLIAGIVRCGTPVVGVDSSRDALRRARDAFRQDGIYGEVTLFAADPRDIAAPGLASIAVLASLTWRGIVYPVDREHTLHCLANAVGHGGRICLDLEAVPDAASSDDTGGPIRFDDGRVFTWRTDPHQADVVALRCEPPGRRPLEVDLSSSSIDSLVQQVLDAGFGIEARCDAETGGDPTAATRRQWIVARRLDGALE